MDENTVFAEAARAYREDRDRQNVGQPDPPPARPAGRSSRFYSAATLAGKAVPPREWLVPDLVPSKTVTLFGGDGGTGKSLLALQLAVAVAAETGWIGRPLTAGRVIFLSAETMTMKFTAA